MARHKPTGCKGSKYEKAVTFWHCAVSLYLHFWRILPRSPVRGEGVIYRLERMQQSRHVNRSLHATFRLVIFSCKIVESKLI